MDWKIVDMYHFVIFKSFLIYTYNLSKDIIFITYICEHTLPKPYIHIKHSSLMKD